MNRIMDELKNSMDELFDGVEEKKGMYRSKAVHLGVTDVTAIVEAVLEGGVNEEAPYPIIHFHTTLAANIPEEFKDRLSISLNELNNVISVGAYPSFGCFCYYPGLSQIFLSYRMPVCPEAPEAEIMNIRYYLGVLYEELDVFADYIMFLLDNEGRGGGLDRYIKYIEEISDWDDLERRAEELEAVIKEIRKGFKA